MSITFNSSSPSKLLDDFKKRINQSQEAGKITTWEILTDNIHFTHKSTQWKNKAFLKPKIQTGKLIFNIIKSESANVSVPAYAFYHGHLIETFLAHFDADFSDGIASSQITDGDQVA